VCFLIEFFCGFRLASKMVMLKWMIGFTQWMCTSQCLLSIWCLWYIPIYTQFIISMIE
jgi:hypothetical protein